VLPTPLFPAAAILLDAVDPAELLPAAIGGPDPPVSLSSPSVRAPPSPDIGEGRPQAAEVLNIMRALQVDKA
jgi:hypothetical protein